jgi:hypothetical protein
MKRFLAQRLLRRVLGEPRTPIRQELDHRQPIALVEPEDRAVDFFYASLAAISVIGALTAILILLNWRPACN